MNPGKFWCMYRVQTTLCTKYKHGCACVDIGTDGACWVAVCQRLMMSTDHYWHEAGAANSSRKLRGRCRDAFHVITWEALRGICMWAYTRRLMRSHVYFLKRKTQGRSKAGDMTLKGMYVNHCIPDVLLREYPPCIFRSWTFFARLAIEGSREACLAVLELSSVVQTS